MKDYSELKKFAENAKRNWEDSALNKYGEVEIFIDYANPTAVLELIAEVDSLRDDLEQVKYETNAWRNSEESVWVEVFYSEGDEPFISSVSGQITIEQLSLIQSEMIEYSELKRLAVGATQGQWKAVDYGSFNGKSSHWYVETKSGENVAFDDSGDPAPNHWDERGEHDMKFIASANPAAVLALIAEVEDLRKEIASLKPFKLDTNKTTIGYTGCVICVKYTNHGGLQCPKLVFHSLSMENQRIVPVEQIRTDHPLESVIRKVHGK